jgi:DNA-binding LytR/AlgR family response regulator
VQKATSKIGNKKNGDIFIRTQSGMIRISISNLKYVEISNHSIIYHTQYGSYEGYGSLKKIEEKLSEVHFIRCNSCYLINLQFVIKVSGWTVLVGEDELQISHPKKKAFLAALNKYAKGEIS